MFQDTRGKICGRCQIFLFFFHGHVLCGVPSSMRFGWFVGFIVRRARGGLKVQGGEVEVKHRFLWVKSLGGFL